MLNTMSKLFDFTHTRFVVILQQMVACYIWSVLGESICFVTI
ncbi:hypothetical protein EG68_10473 [Paragonimus skrjabini miyazakii]|uniref:Uncharacterized protein n=1 Tax=Paragonimus skrjabini miyazakii TaxID=59628 RepID=A0A8S9YFN2_9TREM|nr:hypothetical protein EG68_10473 [Paragonimus skrjabini miyazakii]